MRARLGLVVLAAVTLCGGCASMRGSEAYEEYRAELDKMTDREYVAMATRDLVLDFGDMFRWHVAAGEGIGLTVQPTELLQCGALFADSMRWGFQNRAFGVWTERRKEGGLAWPTIGTT